MTSSPKKSSFMMDLQEIYRKNSQNPAQLKTEIANYCSSCQEQTMSQENYDYLSYLHLISDLLGARWLKSDHPLEPSNFFTQSGWLNSLTHSLPLNLYGGPLPSLPYSAIHYLEDLINTETRVFEWGCGGSTLWFASRVGSIESVEHDERWYKNITTYLRDKNHSTSYVNFAPEQSDYIRAIDRGCQAPYHIIFIDGIFRPDCLRRAIHFLQLGGIIILDDSFRLDYREALQEIVRQGFFYHNCYGLVPGMIFMGCTTFLSQDPASLLQSKLPMDRRSTAWGHGILGH